MSGEPWWPLPDWDKGELRELPDGRSWWALDVVGHPAVMEIGQNIDATEPALHGQRHWCAVGWAGEVWTYCGDEAGLRVWLGKLAVP